MSKRLQLNKPTFTQILTFGIALIALFLIVNLAQKWLIAQDVLERKRLLSLEVQAERARVDELEAMLAETESDAYIERVIREDFGWVREDEGAVILQFEAEPPVTHAQETPAPGVARTGKHGPPHWSDWARLFLQ